MELWSEKCFLCPLSRHSPLFYANIAYKPRTRICSSGGDYSKTQMERVKLNKGTEWVSTKSQSSKTNRFKVLNEKDNRIREPETQRNRYFTVSDPVNHLLGYPRVQVRGRRRGLVIQDSFYRWMCSLCMELNKYWEAKQMLISLQLNTCWQGCVYCLFFGWGGGIWRCHLPIILWLVFKASVQPFILAASLRDVCCVPDLIEDSQVVAALFQSIGWVGCSTFSPVDEAACWLHQGHYITGYPQSFILTSFSFLETRSRLAISKWLSCDWTN